MNCTRDFGANILNKNGLSNLCSASTKKINPLFIYTYIWHISTIYLDTYIQLQNCKQKKLYNMIFFLLGCHLKK